MNKPLVSIIMPVFNTEQFLNKSINSILSQSYDNLELLILDDNSSDYSAKILESLNEPRVQTYKNSKNMGYLRSCNHLFKLAKGDLVTFQDSDDWSDKMRIEQQVNSFINDRDLSLCGTQCYTHKNNKIEESEFPTKHHNLIANLNSGESSIFCGATIMFKRSLIKKYGVYRYFFDRIGSEDLDYFWRMLPNEKMINLNKHLYNYRHNTGSTTQSPSLNPLKYRSTKLAFYAHLQRSHQGYDFLSSEELTDKISTQITQPYRDDKSLIFFDICTSQLLFGNTSGYINAIKSIKENYGFNKTLIRSITALIPITLALALPHKIKRRLVKAKNLLFAKRMGIKITYSQILKTVFI